MKDQAAATGLSESRQGPKGERRLPVLALVFSLAFAILVLLPPLSGYSFKPYPLMKVGDVIDLLTPLLLLPAYWMLFRLDGKNPASFREQVAFMVLAGLWVLGQAMHLTANSIGHLTENLAGTDVYRLTYFYDENLGHYLWHIGVFGLSGLLAYRQWRYPSTERSGLSGINIAAGLIYGFTFFAMTNEGGTVSMSLPLAIFAVAVILVWGRKKMTHQPISLLFLSGYAFAVLLFAIWGIWHHGFPGFFETGIVK